MLAQKLETYTFFQTSLRKQSAKNMLTPNFARQKSMLAKFARSIRKHILMVELV